MYVVSKRAFDFVEYWTRWNDDSDPRCRRKALITAALETTGADVLAAHIIQRHPVLYPEAVQLTAILACPRWRNSFDLADRETGRLLEQEIRAKVIPSYSFGIGKDPIFDWFSLLHYCRPWREADLLELKADLDVVEVIPPARDPACNAGS